MDTGGSMDPYIRTCSQLFTAAHSSTHFKDFQYYYFHNCVYDEVYRDVERMDKVSTDYLLQKLEPDYKTVIVGDAYMAPSELLDKNGVIYYYHSNDTPGIGVVEADCGTFYAYCLAESRLRLQQPPATVALISKISQCIVLTLDGLDKAVKETGS